MLKLLVALEVVNVLLARYFVSQNGLGYGRSRTRDLGLAVEKNPFIEYPRVLLI